jgi:hypothetical protein
LFTFRRGTQVAFGFCAKAPRGSCSLVIMGGCMATIAPHTPMLNG